MDAPRYCGFSRFLNTDDVMRLSQGLLSTVCLAGLLLCGCTGSRSVNVLAEPTPETEALATEAAAVKTPAPQPVDPFAAAGGESLAGRLDRLEEGVADLKIELSRLGPAVDRILDLQTRMAAMEMPKAPPAEPKRVFSAAAPATLPKPTSGGSDMPLVASGKSYAVHLGSFKKRENVAAGWASFKAKHSVALAGLVPLMAPISLNGEQYFRLKVGPFTTWGEAGAACKGLAAKGTPCTVLDYSGEKVL